MLSQQTRERGTALLLMPAAFLVVLVLGSIALDFGLLHARQRELQHLADGAANDAAAASVDLSRLRTDGCIALLPELALESASASVAASAAGDIGIDDVRFELIDGMPSVVVVLSTEADLVLAPALPGGAASRHLDAAATATLFDADADFITC